MKEIAVGFSTGRIAPKHDFRIGEIPQNITRGRIKDNVILVDNLQGRTIEEFTNDEMQIYIDEYNAKQKRADRKIQTSYTEWHKNNGLFTQNAKSSEDIKFAYEAVWCYGNHEDLWHEYFNPETPEERKEALYKEAVLYYYKMLCEFQERYPHIRVLYSVVHADEENGSIHCHTCYQFRADYSRGLACQVCVSKALEQDGIEKIKKRGDAEEEGYQLSRLYKEFRQQVMNPELIRLGYEIKEEVHGREHISSDIYSEKMAEVSRREERVKNAEVLVDSLKAIEECEKAHIPNASLQVKTIPEKKMLGKVIEPEQKIMPTEVWESQKAFGDMQKEIKRAEEIKKKQDILLKQAIERTLTEEDKRILKENEQLKEQNQQQEYQIRRLEQEHEKTDKELKKLVYILERVVEFIKEYGLYYAFEKFIDTVKREFKGTERSR